MTEEHNEERFKVVRAIHLGTWSEGHDAVTVAFIEEWASFNKTKVERVLLSLINSKHVLLVKDEAYHAGVDEAFRLTKKGRAWVTRQ